MLLAPWSRLVVAVALAASLAHAATPAPITWHASSGRLDAHVDAMPAADLLAALATATGWAVYVAPDIDDEFTADFDRLDTATALHRLLRGVDFALLPQRTGPSALYVFRRSRADATRRVAAAARGPRPGTVVPNELLISLRDRTTTSIEALARRLGARVAGGVDALHAWRLVFDDAAAAAAGRKALTGDPDVESLESNVVVGPPAVIEPLDVAAAPGPSLQPDVSPSRDGVIVGLVDSAVQPQGTAVDGFVKPGVSVVGDYQVPEGPLTHGTAMAATIVDGVADAMHDRGRDGGSLALSILPIDVYGGSETTTTWDVARGVAEALDLHANVVNLSLGSDSDSPLLRRLIADGARQGVVFVGAAGNEPVTTPLYPAADPGVTAVTAGDAQNGIAPYANRGRWVDSMAPGQNVVAFQGQAFLGTGTSFSSSLVSGWAAGTMLAGTRDARTVQTQIRKRWPAP